MLIASQLPVDPKSVKLTHLNEGLQTQYISKTNSMEFRLIGGAGEGFFLLDKDQMDAITANTVTLRITDSFTGTNKNYTVRVINKISLMPLDTPDRYMILNVAEEKYDLKKLTVARNYNLIKRDTITGTAPPDYWPPDDGTGQKTLQAIIADISGLSVTYTASTYTPIECNIQGMDVLSAIDLLCEAYGLLWTVEAGTLKVFSVTGADTPTEKDISDIRTTVLPRQISEIAVTYPVVSNGTQRNSRIAKKVSYGTQGEYVDLYMPFLPAIYNTAEVLQNNTELTALTAAIAANYEGLMNIEGGYLVYHAYKTNIGATTLHFSLTFADYGSGPRTIYDAVKYPILTIPQPYTFDKELTGGTGETVLAIFELASGSPLLSGIGNTASASVVVSNSLSTPSTITVRNTGMSQAYPTARGLALKVNTVDGVQWWVIEVNQFALLYTATLTAKTHNFNSSNSPVAGSIADQLTITYNNVQVLTPYPFNYYEAQNIYNPFNKHGIVGDRILVAHSEIGYNGDSSMKNIILDVLPQYARVHYGRYLADVGTGNYNPTTNVIGSGPFGNNSGEIQSSIPAYDLFHLSWLGKQGMHNLVSYNFQQDKYVFTNSQHWATRVRATIAADFCNTPDDFNVTPVEGLNGLKPSGTLTAHNTETKIRSGKAGDMLFVEWDQKAAKWYPILAKPIGAIIEYKISSITTPSSGPYAGLKVATVAVKGVLQGSECLVCTTVDVVDHSNCIFDASDMTGYTGWAFEGIFISTSVAGQLTPIHFAAFNRCCAPNSGTYGSCPG